MDRWLASLASSVALIETGLTIFEEKGGKHLHSTPHLNSTTCVHFSKYPKSKECFCSVSLDSADVRNSDVNLYIHSRGNPFFLCRINVLTSKELTVLHDMVVDCL